MDKQILINEMMRSELERYKELYRQFERALKELPRGSIVSRNGRYSRYVRENGKATMHKITDRDTLRNLKRKRFIKIGLPVLAKRIEMCEEFLNEDILYDPCKIAGDLPEQYHDIQGLGIFLKGDIAPEEWENRDQNQLHMSEKKHVTSGGRAVRSKSEAFIGTRLEEAGLSYLYEPKITVAGKEYYPDFVVLTPGRRRIMYWEHLGMMDDPDYFYKAIKKLVDYAEAGIILGYNLIVTYETLDNPLTLITIDEVIRKIKSL